ncbi:putative 4-hydroxybenzoyl-CoA reductase, beta subunit [uncultured Desulfobacterium sp.]|uniref:Putative 4-hydroxybenzoyl-CoA reductase, beta subunit n=1 Tax=uncultured Desulfobacterium sp. TaxID=201089 RepID=A0A445MR55_9BACT|nr:putative 4-hydroxybenzoyl-CoA reductase, beta subunit [uncultured Desulfobacterium sp.]
MRLPRFEYSAPTTIDEAVAELSEYKDEAMIIAGGTDVIPSMKQRRFTPKRLVDIRQIRGLEYIQSNKDIRIGSLTTLGFIEESGIINQRLPMLAKAAGEVGAPQHRNAGTIGGNLCLNTRCWYFNQSPFFRQCRPVCYKLGKDDDKCQLFPTRKGKANVCYSVYSGDTAPALIALGADVCIVGPGGERVIALMDLYTGDGKRPIALGFGDILKEVIIPFPSPLSAGIYLKHRLREAIDFPLVGVAVNIALDPKDGSCKQLKVVIGAVASKPVIVAGVDEIVQGKKFTDQLVDKVSSAAFDKARPLPNLLGCSQKYRKNMVKILTKRALPLALQKLTDNYTK